MKVKGYAWAGVATDDFQSTFRFFHEVMGLPVEIEDGELAILTVGPGQQLEIFGGDHPGKARTQHPVIAFEVDDMLRAVPRAAAGIFSFDRPWPLG